MSETPQEVEPLSDFLEDEVARLADAEDDGEPIKKPPVPPIVRTIAYIGGALGIAGIYAGVEGNWATAAKVLVGFALALGVTFNPSFGIGAKK